MKKTLSIITTTALMAIGTYVFAIDQNNDIMCTAIYKPVCASVQVQCIKAPCNPVAQTFWNSCEMSKSWNATFLYEWECKKFQIPNGYETRVENALKKYMSNTDFKQKLLNAINVLLNKADLKADAEQKLLYIKDYVENN